MNPPESYQLILRRAYRGRILFSAISFILAIFTGLALVVPEYPCWSVSAFLGALLFSMGARIVHQRYTVALKVCENPKAVFWVHPTRIEDSLLSEETLTACNIATLHLCDGSRLEINLRPAEMKTFVAWLKEQNPSIKLGSYDEPAN